MPDIHICPRCNAQHDGCTAMFDVDHAPRPGDASICMKCGGVNIFNDFVQLRLPTRDEMVQLLNSPEIIAAVITWHKIMEGA